MTGTIHAESVGDGGGASTVASAAAEECDTYSCFFCTGPETD